MAADDLVGSELVIRSRPGKQESLPAKRGRRPAKHSNPDYVQMTVYVPRSLRNSVKARLAENEMEFSGLVEGMLADWLARRRD